ncbi:MAG: hypothetical protein ACFBWO_01400 [Paracoccaceae bacterium]
MIEAALLAVLCVVVVEIALRLPFAPLATRAQLTGRKALRTMQASAVSDHWKERVMLAYAVTMLGCSLRLAAMLVLVFGIVGLIAWGFEFVAPGFGEFLLGLTGLALSLVFATAYVTLRRRLL